MQIQANICISQYKCNNQCYKCNICISHLWILFFSFFFSKWKLAPIGLISLHPSPSLAIHLGVNLIILSKRLVNYLSQLPKPNIGLSITRFAEAQSTHQMASFFFPSINSGVVSLEVFLGILRSTYRSREPYFFSPSHTLHVRQV